MSAESEHLVRLIAEALRPILYPVTPASLEIQSRHHDICVLVARDIVYKGWKKATIREETIYRSKRQK